MRVVVMRTAFWLRCIAAGVGLALVAPGCGVWSANPNNVQIWGRVTHKGIPVKGGVVVFAPGGSHSAESGMGVIEENGTYKVDPARADAVLPGRYEIFIEPPTSQRKSKRRQMEETESDERAFAIALLFPVPKRFFKLETSNLWVEIKNEPNRVDIDLTD